MAEVGPDSTTTVAKRGRRQTVISWVANTLICTRVFVYPGGSHYVLSYLVPYQKTSLWWQSKIQSACSSVALLCALLFSLLDPDIDPYPKRRRRSGKSEDITASSVAGTGGSLHWPEERGWSLTATRLDDRREYSFRSRHLIPVLPDMIKGLSYLGQRRSPLWRLSLLIGNFFLMVKFFWGWGLGGLGVPAVLNSCFLTNSIQVL